MAVGMMEMLWHFAGQYAPAGDVGRFEDGHIEEEAGWYTWKKAASGAFIKAALDSNWLDIHDLHRILVHDWPEHCDDAIHMRLARAREFFADGTAPKLTRLPKSEKETLSEFYANTKAPAVRTASDRRDASLGPPPPSPAKPRHIVLAAAASFPLSAAAVRTNFATADDDMIGRIVLAAQSVVPQIEDHELVAVIQKATKRNQESAALYLHTVPEVVRTWQA